jgi:inhibitor of growth protein 3
MGNLVPPLSASNTGANTPLNPLSGNTAGGSSIANAAIARIVSATSGTGRANPTALQNMQTQALLNQQRLANAQTASQAAARQEREMSAGSDTKRRRLNASLGALPPASSALSRQASIGPGTPKPSTPGGSRAGSVGPGARPQKRALTVKKANPQQPLRKQLGNKAGLSKKNRRRLAAGQSRASPSTTADTESAGSENGTEDEEMTGINHDGAADADDDEGDDTKYCFCQSVSYGDMVACDNEDCKYQWFHWDCVGIKEEPVGDWLCPECSKPTSKVKRQR